MEGHGYGTLDGNGQAWYDFVNGESNYPSMSFYSPMDMLHVLSYVDRPHMIVITAEDSYFHGLRFVQPQMW